MEYGKKLQKSRGIYYYEKNICKKDYSFPEESYSALGYH